MNSANFSISLNGEDGELLRKYFDGLAEGGKVTVPVAKHPWGAESGCSKTNSASTGWLILLEREIRPLTELSPI